MGDRDHADPDRAGQLHHVELYAADLDAAVDFWGWLLGELGYERKNDWPGGRSWINGPTYVVLVAADAGDPDDTSDPDEAGDPDDTSDPDGASDADGASDGDGTPTPPFDRRAPGLNHLAFHAASRAQVDRLTEGVHERPDATVLYDDQHPYAGGYYALYCEDPEGLKVEVVGPAE